MYSRLCIYLLECLIYHLFHTCTQATCTRGCVNVRIEHAFDKLYLPRTNHATTLPLYHFPPSPLFPLLYHPTIDDDKKYAGWETTWLCMLYTAHFFVPNALFLCPLFLKHNVIHDNLLEFFICIFWFGSPKHATRCFFCIPCNP